MAILSLGVLDVAYSDPDDKNLTTTGEVAEFLEKWFEVMGTFWELYSEKISSEIASAMANDIAAMAKGEPLGKQPIQRVMEKIQLWFSSYLDQGEWEAHTGIKIGAAHEGVSHRFKDVKNLEGKRDTRPAFIDTGLYQAAFRAWIEHWAPAEAEANRVFQVFKAQMLSDRAGW
jgi:hypothetical protein